MPGYRAYRWAAFLSRHLPGRSAYWVALRFADLFHALRRRERQGVRSNLEQVLRWSGHDPGARELARRVRQTYRYFGKYLVDFFRYARLDTAELERRVAMPERALLEDTFRQGKGVIILTAHLGNWELGGAILSALGFPVNAVVKPERMPRLNRLMQQQREQRGLRLLPLGHSALSLLRCLKRGEIVALLADRDFTRHHMTMNLFGKPVGLPLGAAWLSLQSGAPILPAFLIREPDDTFRLRLHPPWWPGAGTTLADLMARLRDALQAEIAAHPEQWFIFHDFWAGEPEHA